MPGVIERIEALESGEEGEARDAPQLWRKLPHGPR
jgi:hypothetical protein